ncbi:sensor histidine kinase [Peterkaempfera sp. SMS 1(5)a]|uniref:sensor histidine kinase n=1 Tax=Peterkaempfera podocarpi TaxID=3232308 RepID=UPI00366DD456
MGDAAGARGPGGAEGDPQRWAQGWRRGVLAAGMLVYPGVAASGVARYTSGTAAALGYAMVAVFCAAYVLAGVSFARRHLARLRVLMVVMAVLFAAEVPVARNFAFYLGAVVVSFAAMVHRRHMVPIVAAGAGAALVVPWAVRPWQLGLGWTEAVMTVFTALAVFGFSEIVTANRALLDARAEVARLASDAERNRIARDLHDLLGHSLTVIAVKSGLARRLAEKDSPRAVEEITAVEVLSRQALADVRAAVSGYREVTLAGELAHARELLRAAGVVADLPTTTEAVAPAQQELFGWILREGVTNVVRHARASRCTVRLSASSVEVVDDGTGAAAPRGNGLSGLTERVATAGGTVEAGPALPRGWRLRVTLGGDRPRGPLTTPEDAAA